MKLKPHFIVAPLVLAGLIAGGYYIDRARASNQSRLSGFFESQPTLASSRLGGRVAQILVKEGQDVKKGDLLVRLSNPSYAASTAAQKAQAEEALAQLRETLKGPRSEDIAKQHAVVQEAQAQYDKAINGPRPEEISAAIHTSAQARAAYQKVLAGSRPQEVAAARAAADAALANYRQAQNGPTAEEKAELRARVTAATAQVELTRKQLDRTQALVEAGALARQQLDAAKAAYDQAVAAQTEAQQAYDRAARGTRPEQISAAKHVYDQALAQLKLVEQGPRKEDVEAARQAMLAAASNARLLQQGTRPEDIAAARARLTQAEETLNALQRGNRPEDIAKAQAAHRAAALQASSSSANLAEERVFAPFDARVDRVLVADGDVVQAGQSVVQLSNPSDVWLRVYLPESDLAKVKVGDAAELEVDGVNGIVAGYVESVASQGEFTPANLQSPEERGRQVFGVRIRLRQTDARVKPGMYATVKRVGLWP